MGALGQWPDYRMILRQAEDTDIQKTADGGAENKCKDIKQHKPTTG